MTSARDEILARLRSHSVADTSRPPRFEEGVTYADPREQFRSVLEAVGGRCVFASDLAAVDAGLQEIAAYRDATRRCSRIAGAGETNFDLDALADPHQLEDVEFAVLPGRLAVAENAAVWVTDEDVPHRVLYFITQHLALVVPAENVVHNLHEAYERVSVGASPFGCWISGPSKTADIEQSLVIGAHGPRSLTVFLVGPQHTQGHERK